MWGWRFRGAGAHRYTAAVYACVPDVKANLNGLPAPMGRKGLALA